MNCILQDQEARIEPALDLSQVIVLPIFVYEVMVRGLQEAQREARDLDIETDRAKIEVTRLCERLAAIDDGHKFRVEGAREMLAQLAINATKPEESVSSGRLCELFDLDRGSQEALAVCNALFDSAHAVEVAHERDLLKIEVARLKAELEARMINEVLWPGDGPVTTPEIPNPFKVGHRVRVKTYIVPTVYSIERITENGNCHLRTSDGTDLPGAFFPYDLELVP